MRVDLESLNVHLRSQWGVEIQARTGINTGEVVVGDPFAGQSLVIGDPVNVAARLEQAAQPGEILVGQTTLQLVRDAVTIEHVEPLSLKGKSLPVEAVRLLTVTGEMRSQPRKLQSTLVGREKSGPCSDRPSSERRPKARATSSQCSGQQV
jgi:class 3 adenylate cyclase